MLRLPSELMNRLRVGGRNRTVGKVPRVYFLLNFKRKPLLDFAGRVGFGVFSFLADCFCWLCVWSNPKEDRGGKDYQSKVDQ